MSGPRDQPVQQPPHAGQDLSGFPKVDLDVLVTLFRTHRAAFSPWFFDSEPGRGRFNLRAPRGTCYLASSRETAVRELIGPAMAKEGFVTSSLLKGRVVSTLRLPHPVRAAALAEDGIAFAVVGSELSAAVSYDLSCRWAEAFAESGFDALWYQPRFSGSHQRALALFGPMGVGQPADGWLKDDTPMRTADVVAGMPGIRVDPVPTHPAMMHVLDDPK